MSSPTQDLIPQLNIGSTFGALFIGVIISAVLFGLSNVQAFIYFQTHRDTGMTFYKLAVIWLWILDAMHLALIFHCVYYHLVINYANFKVLTELVWSGKLEVVFKVLIIFSVNLFYVYRIWILSKSKSIILPITVGITILLQLAIIIVFVWAIYQCHLFSDLLKIQWSTFMTLGSITFADVVIASSLCYLLTNCRTGFSNTDSLITKIMVYVIGTGCLTSVCSIATVITFAVMQTNFIFIAIDFLLAKVYVNSFLALLNARHYGHANTDHNSFHNRRGVYRPELYVQALEDEELQVSRRDVIKRPDDEAVDLSSS
ncbi:hypothetical protein BDR04DRAFT_1103638 [Suillus decipiens]|nr:hypothetical protein BDR04DRAFT_1103638 [Suillus decipiens]